MEISKEKLAPLATPAYDDYQRLIRRDKLVYNWTRGFYFVVAYAAYIVGIGFIFIRIATEIENRSAGWGACVGLVLFYLAFGGLGAIAEPLATFFDFLARLARKKGRRQELELWFEPIEKEIETDAIKILSDVETEVLRRDKENTSINYNLRFKRKWQTWYANDLVKVKNNCDLNSAVADIVDENLKYVKYDMSKQQDFRRLKQLLEDPYREYRTLNSKLYSLYGRPDSIKLDVPDWMKRFGHVYSPPIRTGRSPRISVESPRKYDASKPLGLDVPITQPVNKTETPTVRVERPQSPRPTVPSVMKPESKKISSSDILGIQREPKSDGRVEVTNELTLESITPVRDDNSDEDYQYSGRVIKTSPEYYQKATTRNMQIGMKGELCVLEYEGHRVFKEEGSAYLIRLEHVSVTQGDGLGYDIVSIENNKKIYIEVKTTSGKADANLFFTGREFAAMDEHGDRYYLYRIYEFDESTGNGKLNIYKGKEEILGNYKIRPKDWVFSKK